MSIPSAQTEAAAVAPSPSAVNTPAGSQAEEANSKTPVPASANLCISSEVVIIRHGGNPDFLKRRRPRRYGVNDPPLQSAAVGGGSSSHPPHSNKTRGSTSTGYESFVLNVNVAEEITSKLMQLLHTGPGAIFVVSASGEISSVQLRHCSNPRTSTTYEGRFPIVSFQGSYVLDGASGQKTEGSNMSISLLSCNGSKFGGRVGGTLVAASPVQISIGRFRPDAETKSDTVAAAGPST